MPPLSWTLRDSPWSVRTGDRFPAYSFGEQGKSIPKTWPAAFQSALSPAVLLPESFRGGCSFGAALPAHTRARPLLRACIRRGPCSTGGGPKPANPDRVNCRPLMPPRRNSRSAIGRVPSARAEFARSRRVRARSHGSRSRAPVGAPLLLDHSQEHVGGENCASPIAGRRDRA